MDEVVFAKIIHLIEEKIGISASSMSYESWIKLIHKRMKLYQMTDPELYFQTLKESAQEFQEFVEMIVVPETWFFREQAAYDFLIYYATHIWQGKKNGSQLKILSVPCSTGEEPYSIVMTLKDSGLLSTQFSIDAIDISGKAITTAQKAVYGKNSFRCKDLTFRDYYFNKVQNQYHLKQSVKNQVNFRHENIFDPQILIKQYDIIFCRNLFIYLNKIAQQKLLKIIDLLLLPKGILFISPVETECIKNLKYTPDPMISSCAFHKSLKKTPAALPANPKKLPVPKVHPSLHKTLLEEARHLADRGDFEEAIPLCHKYLKKNNTDPQGFFLLGVIEHALGAELEAENFFLKTVYLEPTHYEALVYLTLLAEKKGDSQQAQLFQTRAKKAINDQEMKIKESK